MATIFSKIAQGEIPAFKIAENDDFLAFLDVNPLVMGHVLVIPKLEIDYIFDVDDVLLSSMILFAKQVAIALKKTVPCKRIGVAVIGLEVPHCHIHLVPMQTMADINFMQPKLKPAQQNLQAMCDAIVANL